MGVSQLKSKFEWTFVIQNLTNKTVWNWIEIDFKLWRWSWRRIFWLKSNQRKEGKWILYTDFIRYHFYASLKVFSTTRRVSFKICTLIRHHPFHSPCNDSELRCDASSILSSMMTQSKNKFGICSKGLLKDTEEERAYRWCDKTRVKQ